MTEPRRDHPENDLPRPDRTPHPEDRRDWETLQQNASDQTQRLRIVSGWLYRVITTDGHVALTFVPAAE
jgi:hypothetical protein